MRMLTTVASTAALLAMTGCSTLTKGTSQTVTVNTDPPGAVCNLSRDSQTLAVVNPTPGSVSISKSSKPVSVLCTKASFIDASGTMSSEFQAMTFGNIIFGGLIGIAVDAASGATHEYPPIVTITMEPKEFGSATDRDAFFERMKQTLEREAAEVRERVQKDCQRKNGAQPATGTGKTCDSELAAVDAGTKTKLAEIEQRRLAAKVASA